MERNMLLQIKNKKAVSAIIGYVLLVTFAVAIGSIVYTWLKSYVPTEGLECPEDVALLIKESNCTQFPTNYTLEIKIQNNGFFDVNGYFIHAIEKGSNQNLATIDISQNITKIARTINPNVVLFTLGENDVLEPGEQADHIFNITFEIDSIEIIPVIWQEQDNKIRYVNCGEAKITEKITCT